MGAALMVRSKTSTATKTNLKPLLVFSANCFMSMISTCHVLSGAVATTFPSLRARGWKTWADAWDFTNS